MLDKKNYLEEIIDIEFSMFQEVNNFSKRAPCQDNKETFYIMRYSQWDAFSLETIKSYLDDLKVAQNENRNLIMEKYGYMMFYTDHNYFVTRLEKHLPQISQEKEEITNKIANILAEDQQEFRKKYPNFSQKGRTDKEGRGETSIRIYNLGELKTFSLRTLNLYLKDILVARDIGRSLIYKIYEKTAGFYGYESLEKAENHLF